jgi:ammonium transporter
LIGAFLIPIIPLAAQGADNVAADLVGPTNKLDKADMAWVLTSTGLVFFMVPGLALFYGGMARRKNLLGTMMHSMISLSIVGVLWVLVGYSLAFGTSQNGWIGWSGDLVLLHGITPSESFASTTIPVYLHCMYQGMFAIITPALISGAIAERVRFFPYSVFIAAWLLVVYCPLAHWVWAVDATGTPTGIFGSMGALDFAGGTVVHIAAGVSGLAAVLVLRPRRGYPKQAMHPSSMALTLLGAGILWFGWFGFNGGSGLSLGKGLAVAALTATQVAAATAGLTWTVVEWWHRGKPTALGFATGAVAGLVGVTPAAGFIPPWAAIVLGSIVASICYLTVWLKPRLGYDDSLDAFGVHGVGGLVGALLTGLFASAPFFRAATGDPHAALGALGPDGANWIAQIFVQLKACLAAIAYSFVLTAAIVIAIDRIIGFQLTPEDEIEGLDYAVHGEVAFDFGFASELAIQPEVPEPKPAAKPPKIGERFSLVVEGAPAELVMKAWSDICQSSALSSRTEFRELYPHLTTVSGNRFRFRGGDPGVISNSLSRLLAMNLPDAKIFPRVEA